MAKFNIEREDPYFFTNKMMFFQRDFVQELKDLKVIQSMFIQFCNKFKKDPLLLSTWDRYFKLQKDIILSDKVPDASPMKIYANTCVTLFEKIKKKLNTFEKNVLKGEYDVTCQSTKSIIIKKPDNHIRAVHKFERTVVNNCLSQIIVKKVMTVLDLGCSIGNTVMNLLRLHPSVIFDVIYVDIVDRLDHVQLQPHVLAGQLKYKFVKMDMNSFLFSNLIKLKENIDVLIMAHSAYYLRTEIDKIFKVFHKSAVLCIYHDYSKLQFPYSSRCSKLSLEGKRVVGIFHGRKIDENLVSSNIAHKCISDFPSEVIYESPCNDTLHYHFSNPSSIKVTYRSRVPQPVKIIPTGFTYEALLLPKIIPGMPPDSNYYAFPKVDGVGAFLYVRHTGSFLLFRNMLTYKVSCDFDVTIDEAYSFYVEVIFLAEDVVKIYYINYLRDDKIGDYVYLSYLCFDFSFINYLGFRPMIEHGFKFEDPFDGVVFFSKTLRSRLRFLFFQICLYR